MVGKTAPVIPEELTAEDWRGLLGAYPNALLIGPSDATGRVIEALLPRLQQPVCRCPGGELTLPQNPGGTLIVAEVAVLSPDDQQRLLAWLLDPGRLTQVVATASSALFPLVTNGSFLDVLYYRLNVMAFTVGSSAPHSASA